MTDIPSNPSPQDWYRIYNDGFAGCTYDSESMKSLMAKSKNPLFSVSAMAGVEGSSEGQMALLYRALKKLDPKAYEEENQTTGDCTSHGTRNGVDTTRAIEIIVMGQAESFITRGATEPIYGFRGHRGQGMSVSVAMDWISEEGGYLLRQKYPALDIDLTTYDADIGIGWGRGGPPEAVRTEARKHQIQTVSLCTSAKEVADAMQNGYAIVYGGNQGFSNRRDDDGFAAPKGRWSHCMSWVGHDHRPGFRQGFLVVNSWGRWNSGPKHSPDQPEGSFWIDDEVAADMISSRQTFAISNFVGFPAQTIPTFLTGVFG